MQIINTKIDDIRPYEKNPRKNDKAVDAVAASIKEFGFQQPIVVDKNGVIVVGHTRYRAAKKLHIDVVPVVFATELTDEQVAAYRLADNRTNELSSWDADLLKRELDEIATIDMSEFGFSDIDELLGKKKKIYSDHVNVPQYEITGETPPINKLTDSTAKYESLLFDIDRANIEENEKEFLRLAATRHIVFNYRNIAEYYARATKEMQKEMERSALVIIDYEDAIANGYVRLHREIEETMEEDE